MDQTRDKLLMLKDWERLFLNGVEEHGEGEKSGKLYKIMYGKHPKGPQSFIHALAQRKSGMCVFETGLYQVYTRP